MLLMSLRIVDCGSRFKTETIEIRSRCGALPTTTFWWYVVETYHSVYDSLEGGVTGYGAPYVTPTFQTNLLAACAR